MLELLNGVRDPRCHVWQGAFGNHAAHGQLCHASQLLVRESIVDKQSQNQLTAEGLDVLECNRVRLHAVLLHHGSNPDDEHSLKCTQYSPHDHIISCRLLALCLGRSHTYGVEVEMYSYLPLLA